MENRISLVRRLPCVSQRGSEAAHLYCNGHVSLGLTGTLSSTVSLASKKNLLVLGKHLSGKQ